MCVRVRVYVCVCRESEDAFKIVKLIGAINRGESSFRGPMMEASRITVRTYVLVAEQMACDWHPRSATRPRAANAANSRRLLARRSTHPHPRPRPTSPTPSTRYGPSSLPSSSAVSFGIFFHFFGARRRENSRIFIPFLTFLCALSPVF